MKNIKGKMSEKNEGIRGERKKNRRYYIIKRKKKDCSKAERREKEIKEVEKIKLSCICYQLNRFCRLCKKRYVESRYSAVSIDIN